MKKIFIGMSLLLGVTFTTSAASSTKQTFKAVQITTSCGTSYSVTCPSCTSADLVNIALSLDEQDCS